MAHLNVKPDPAFLKMQAMNKVRHQYFRFNARTAKITTIYMVVVPSIIGYIAWKTDGMFSFRGKLKGDTIYDR
ncbi:hypothetical protein E4U22_003574 [Claviceps purpurea]|uniref:NADH-ubiquinone oxidoreductase B15 subunit n=4 Tax=Claviceps TaxID=5110 RepID=M1VX73_CLAP2|nr:hypothetical protein E4U57_006335 [Claviceps arundinis]KAG6033956.1 hypothetical protein E4U19_006069 [Claviceps sp. Clav32 group G5]KAG6069312.1 hypothetical protein E4U32_000026 [Claviceps aff. humidiphila group G2b]KAG6090091.1 hypothetical protein E4U15_000081 [Claviceps sp. LM218 group G6]KAG6097640.1 hypothetical protein E4U30_000457 [Claviceps sp. LM220 group G6]KAG6109120.1 hypothetical protein E4U31_007086 [Claviceps sp. LM219 group G6]KAG6118881.1 hypothetical protein E4U13_00819